MALHLMNCPACSGELHFEPGSRVTTCGFCGAQVALDAAPAAAAPVLAEGLWIKANATWAVQLVGAGVALPTSKTETLASGHGDKTELHLDLQAGNDSNPAGNRDLASLVFQLSERHERNMPAAQLKVTVEPNGAVSLEVREEGTTNTRDYDVGRLAIRAAD